MIIYILLLIATYIFGSLLQTGLGTKKLVLQNDEWSQEKKVNSTKRASTLILFSTIFILIIGFAGWYFKGNVFLIWFVIVLILTYIQGKSWNKR